MSNRLTELAKLGQSIWYDQMERKLVASGKLKKMIDDEGLRGLTSNPTIFEKAIAASEDYTDQLRQLATLNKTQDEIYDELVIQDIGAGADVFRPVYDQTKGLDGYVSLEVSPLLARDTKGTIAEAKRLFAWLKRPNVLIKIPATPEGIPAIEEVIASGINVNVTLIFNNDVYHKVMEAYIRGLERRAEKGEPIDKISSVASFFISRIDAASDKQIEEKIAQTTDANAKKDLESLLGKVAIANAKSAYQEFRKIFGSERFKKLQAKGAKVQRPLWASTGTKSKKYSDVLYVDSLIGADTVNTVPPPTYEAFRDHGTVARTLDQNVDEAYSVLDRFKKHGFSLKAITEKLTADGVKSFEDSFVTLMNAIKTRRAEAIDKTKKRIAKPVVELAKLGQSIWYDQLERKLVASGKLKKMIDDDGLRGLTSNPTILEKAIAGSPDYVDQLRELAAKNKTFDQIYDEMVIQDISAAADTFRPVYDATKGLDGYVSLEVSPLLARDTAATVAEAKRLFAWLNRPNVLIKIPATPEGIPAIEEVIAAGINVNVTLIFSNDVYHKVMEAYVRGLERRAEKNQPIDKIASVASFFVSRIDSSADKQIEDKIAQTSDPNKKKELEGLLGKVAIANAKSAYQEFKKVFESERFKKLKAKGAQVQRPLWASTGTKSKKYSDVLYVDSLIGADTVNTVPPPTYEAFRDHGAVARTLDQNVDEAYAVLDKFAKNGFSLKDITTKLEAEGVKSFDESFIALMTAIKAGRASAVRRLAERITTYLPGSLNDIYEATAQRAEKDKAITRIWKKDASLWKNEAEHQKIIGNALGWLEVIEETHKNAKSLREFADSVKGEFTDVVVLGMGGSSLASEVIRRVFGRRQGYPALSVLDSTIPESVRNLESQIDLKRTLFVVASKSGTTTESLMFYRYFYDRVKSVKGDNAGENFVAVTDPGSEMIKLAERDKFRKVFVNRSDIGGRFAGLSYFGMVPAAISGVDVEELLNRALDATYVTKTPNTKNNPPALLGVIMGAMALNGRDKLTIITQPPLDTLGLWIEQLVAASTGKEGRGIVPITGEPLLTPADYSDDRLFVQVHLRGANGTSRLKELVAAGHPVVDIILENELDLGEMFFVWEFATAMAGALIGINAFDQPNIQEAKDNTVRHLEAYKAKGKLENEERDVINMSDKPAAEAKVHSLLKNMKSGDYFALTEYFAESSSRDKLIGEIRQEISKELGVATTTGYGPRFLHSTGQLHKGGADNGVFMQLIADSEDVKIPGEKFSFGVFSRAQALGDFESLTSRNRRAIRIHLGKDVDAGLQWLLKTIKNAVAKA